MENASAKTENTNLAVVLLQFDFDRPAHQGCDLIKRNHSDTAAAPLDCVPEFGGKQRLGLLGGLVAELAGVGDLSGEGLDPRNDPPLLQNRWKGDLAGKESFGVKGPTPVPHATGS